MKRAGLQRAGAARTRETKVILVVDDNPTCREFARIVLEQSGYRVIEAPDGEQAIARARETTPDLVLLDIRMPVLDGYQTLRVLRDTSAASIRVIALTALAMKGDRETAIEVGFDGYLTKPINIAELCAAVTTALSSD